MFSQKHYNFFMGFVRKKILITVVFVHKLAAIDTLLSITQSDNLPTHTTINIIKKVEGLGSFFQHPKHKDYILSTCGKFCAVTFRHPYLYPFVNPTSQDVSD